MKFFKRPLGEIVFLELAQKRLLNLWLHATQTTVLVSIKLTL